MIENRPDICAHTSLTTLWWRDVGRETVPSRWFRVRVRVRKFRFRVRVRVRVRWFRFRVRVRVSWFRVRGSGSGLDALT